MAAFEVMQTLSECDRMATALALSPYLLLWQAEGAQGNVDDTANDTIAKHNWFFIGATSLIVATVAIFVCKSVSIMSGS